MAQLGNQNAKRGRQWRDALRRARIQMEDERGLDRGQLLVEIGKVVHDLALDGDPKAISEIGNREDGKAIQATDIHVEWTAKTVIQTFTAKLGEAGTLELLKAAKAENLIPILKQVTLEQPKAIDHEAEPA